MDEEYDGVLDYSVTLFRNVRRTDCPPISMKYFDADDNASRTDVGIVCMYHPDRYSAVEGALE